jgi:hypothetical protein
MMGHRYRTRTGDELDLISKCRKVLLFMHRPGVCRRIKEQISRRIRRENKRVVGQAEDGF